MGIKEVRKELGISNSWIAKNYGYANVKSYNKSAGKKKIEKLTIALYEQFKNNKK